MNKSAASAASPDSCQFQAVIKSLLAQPAGSLNPGEQAPGERRTAARLADEDGCFPGAWSPGFGLRLGCAGSRLDHGLELRLWRLRGQPT